MGRKKLLLVVNQVCKVLDVLSRELQEEMEQYRE